MVFGAFFIRIKAELSSTYINLQLLMGPHHMQHKLQVVGIQCSLRHQFNILPIDLMLKCGNSETICVVT